LQQRPNLVDFDKGAAWLNLNDIWVITGCNFFTGLADTARSDQKIDRILLDSIIFVEIGRITPTVTSHRQGKGGCLFTHSCCSCEKKRVW
jgi:hypothetical protein